MQDARLWLLCFMLTFMQVNFDQRIHKPCDQYKLRGFALSLWYLCLVKYEAGHYTELPIIMQQTHQTGCFSYFCSRHMTKNIRQPTYARVFVVKLSSFSFPLSACLDFHICDVGISAVNLTWQACMTDCTVKSFGICVHKAVVHHRPQPKQPVQNQLCLRLY